MTMNITAEEIAQLVNGEVIGDPQVSVHAPAGLEHAQKGDISFLSNMKYEPFVYSTKASVLLVDKEYSPQRPIRPTLIKVDNVYESVAYLLGQFEATTEEYTGIAQLASVSTSSQIHDQVSIDDFAVVKEEVIIGEGTHIHSHVFVGRGVVIGKRCAIYPGAKIYRDCRIGDDVIIHANAVIGADGFGFSKGDGNQYAKIPQIGNVIIGDHVEIGANTTVDRATMGSTRIHSGVKLDNLIQVGHNVVIGENTVIAAQTAIAGSTEIGKNCLIGGQVAIVGHIKVADGTQIQGKSGVTKASKEGQKLFGVPAIDFSNYMRAYSVFRNLPDLVKELNQLKKHIKRDDHYR